MPAVPGPGPTVFSTALTLALLGACRPSDEVDTAAVDTGDTHPPPAVDLEDLVPPDGFWQGDYYTVPSDRGLEWERDETFSIDNFSVPQVYVLPDESFIMLATNMEDPQGRWYLTSEDGLTWTAAEEPLFLPDAFPQDCGNRLEDGALLVKEDGTQHLLLEGTMLDEETDSTDWRVWCQAESADGESFTAVEGYFYTGSEADGDLPSVPYVFLLADWNALIYYMGDLYSEVGGEEAGNGIRIARWEQGEDQAEPWVARNILPRDLLDPMPVYLEGGGMRLYHTHTLDTSEDDRRDGPAPGYADSTDGVTFTDPVRLLTPEGHCYDGMGECLLDPAFLHLPDDTLVLYYTLLERDDNDQTFVSIGRAFAVD